MAVAYKSAGAGTATETSGAALSPACPATVDAGDILIAHVFWEGTTTAPSTPANWTLLDGPRVIETTIARHWVFGKIADGSEDGAAVAFGSPAVTTQRGARIYSFSGRTSGSITELVTGFAHQSHATDPQNPGVTTTMAGALAVLLIGQNDNNTIGDFTGESGGDFTAPVAEYTAALTPGLLLDIQTAIPTADPGSITGGTFNTTNDPVGVIGFQIKPAQTLSHSAAVAGTGTVASVGGVVSTTFPSTPVLDDFERTEDPVSQGGLWDGPAAAAHSGRGAADGDEWRADAGGLNVESSYRTNVVTPNTEAWGEIGEISGLLLLLGARITNAGGQLDGYAVTASTTALGISRIDNDVGTTLATYSTPVSAGKLVGIRVRGSTVSAYMKDGSQWLRIAQVTDSTYSGDGAITIASVGNGSWRSFGGGAVTVERSAAISGTGAVTAAAFQRELLRASASAATGAIESSGIFWTTFERSSAFAATGTLTAAAFQRDLQRASALAATGAVTLSDYRRELLRAVALAATGAIDAAGREELARAAALSATGAVTAAPQRELQRQASFIAASNVEATGAIEGGIIVHERQAAVSGSGAVTSDGFALAERAAALSATSAVESSAIFFSIFERSPSLAATGAVASAGLPIRIRTAAFSASSDIASDFERTLQRSAALVASGEVAVTGQVGEVLERAAALSALAAISATPEPPLWSYFGGNGETYAQDADWTYADPDDATYTTTATADYDADPSMTYAH